MLANRNYSTGTVKRVLNCAVWTDLLGITALSNDVLSAIRGAENGYRRAKAFWLRY
jgi:hypothetical protein